MIIFVYRKILPGFLVEIILEDQKDRFESDCGSSEVSCL